MADRAPRFDGNQLRWVDGLPEIRTSRLILRLARKDEFEKIARYQSHNRDHLQIWEPLRNEEFYTASYWRDVPKREQEAAKNRHYYRFRMLLREDQSEFVGAAALRDVSFGVDWSCVLGYSLDKDYQGQGLALEGVSAVVDFAVNALNLRRVEACYMPGNLRSAALLNKLGFEVEGLLRSSLMVNGEWEDHVITSLINPSWPDAIDS